MLGTSWQGEVASSQECGQWQAKGLQASQDPHTLYVSPLSFVHTHMNLKHATHVPARTPHTHTTHMRHPCHTHMGSGDQKQESNNLPLRASQPPLLSLLWAVRCAPAKTSFHPP